MRLKKNNTSQFVNILLSAYEWEHEHENRHTNENTNMRTESPDFLSPKLDGNFLAYTN